jgi:hypothetical protein
MTIKLDHLSEDALIDLNHRIVERLRFLQQVRTHRSMLQFRIGDHVTFNLGSRTHVVGVLTRSPAFLLTTYA